MIDNDIQIYDPTWGAGYVNNNIFTPRFTFDFFQITPEKSIQRRMPHDPIWQLLNYPVNVEDYYSDNYQLDSTKLIFYYRDSIVLYETQDHITQCKNVLRRVEVQGIYNQATADYVMFLKNEIENDKINTMNQGVAYLNAAVEQTNAYANYFNRQFTPEKSREESENMLLSAQSLVEKTLQTLQNIQEPSPQMQANINNLKKSANALSSKVSEGLTFVNQYFTTDPSYRKQLFQVPVQK